MKEQIAMPNKRIEDEMFMARQNKKQLNDILAEYHLSNNEKKELKQWVKSGNSPYENPYYICNENGYICNFIEAKRFIEELYDEFSYYKITLFSR
jgi:hypothetical protein